MEKSEKCTEKLRSDWFHKHYTMQCVHIHTCTRHLIHSEMLGSTVGRAWVIWGWIQCMDYSGYMQISENNSIMLEKQRMLYTFASTATDQTSEPGRKDKQSIPCRTLYHHGHWEPQEGCYPAKEKEGELLNPSSQDHANPDRHALMLEDSTQHSTQGQMAGRLECLEWYVRASL